MPLEVMWSLTEAWYGDRLDPWFAPKPVTELQTILADVGLVGPFWQLT